MSTASTNAPRLSEEVRYELAEAAHAAEQKNRPRSWLFLATVLFLIAGIFIILAIHSRQQALKVYYVQADRLAKVQNLQPQFAVIERQQNAGDSQAYAPLTNLLTRIEQAAAQAGLAEKPSIPKDISKTASSGAVKHEYTYTMRDASLENLLAWIDKAKQNVPGLHVSGIKITPESKAWKLEVIFVRWERSL